MNGCAGTTGAPSNNNTGGGSGGDSVAISTSTLPSGTVGTAYSATLQATGGSTPYDWSVSTGSLPAGLTLNASSGLISGTPTASGTTNFTAQVSDASNNTATKSLSIAVSAASQALTITTTSVPNGSTNTAYSAFLYAGGGKTPYKWSISGGALPAGLTLNASSGLISGTPTASGTTNFTAQVSDASNNTATKSLSIAVSAASQALTITTTSVPNGSTNTAYSAFLYAGGGKTPYTWSISGGALPAGLTLSAAGDLAGVPTTAATSSFTAKVTDSSSPANTATATFSITIAQGTAYSVSLSWTASPSSGVAGYNVYRTTQSGSNYVRINTAVVSSLAYSDGTVVDGTTYYYVLTAVDGSGNESVYSTQVQMAIP
ncbi:MAG: putative Ig domain-containing protein [Candidatus Acidiferrales bacterium]